MRRTPLLQRAPALALALLCAALAVYAAGQAGAARRVQRADVLGLHGDYAGALREALAVHSSPAEGQALLVAAAAAAASGDDRDAADLLGLAVRRDPQDWSVHFSRALVLRRLGDPAAGAEMATARRLNPRLALPAGFTT